jgi:hypothetical protein
MRYEKYGGRDLWVGNGNRDVSFRLMKCRVKKNSINSINIVLQKLRVVTNIKKL